MDSAVIGKYVSNSYENMVIMGCDFIVVIISYCLDSGDSQRKFNAHKNLFQSNEICSKSAGLHLTRGTHIFRAVIVFDSRQE